MVLPLAVTGAALFADLLELFCSDVSLSALRSVYLSTCEAPDLILLDSRDCGVLCS